MARLKIRFLLAATLGLSSGGLFLATAAPGRRGGGRAHGGGGDRLHRPSRELRQGHRVRARLHRP
jgi:hypothetical protein